MIRDSRELSFQILNLKLRQFSGKFFQDPKNSLFRILT